MYSWNCMIRQIFLGAHYISTAKSHDSRGSSRLTRTQRYDNLPLGDID
jgi:hypothetical protein